MILFGKVYRGLMVDVRALNEKLLRRSENMLIDLTGRTRADSQKALKQAEGKIKIAALLLQGCSVDEATNVLHACDGHLGKAMAVARRPQHR
jgi:N-acetylmuramic acid 6-phosphate etherase